MNNTATDLTAPVIHLDDVRRERLGRAHRTPQPRPVRHTETVLALIGGDHFMPWALVARDGTLLGQGDVNDGPADLKRLFDLLSPTFVAIRDDQAHGSFGAGVAAGIAVTSSRLVDFAVTSLFERVDATILAEAIARLVRVEGTESITSAW
jgi:hypothetical protein